MNHTEAVKLGACEKYLLGELSPPARDEFEEHYFGCPECARDIHSSSVFMAASRQVLDPVLARTARPEAVAAPSFRGWFAWFRPAFAVPVCALLVLIIGYQNFVTVPQLKSKTGEGSSGALLKPILLHPGISRGAEPVIPATPGQPSVVYLDIPTEPAYASYLIRLEDAAGSSRDLLVLSSADVQKSPLLKMPSDLVPGVTYTLRVLGAMQQGMAQSDVATFSFRVAILDTIGQH